MFIQRKPYLRDIKRVRVSEGRNLERGLRLDRNERVANWPRSFLAEVFAAVPEYYASTYPDNDTLYRKLAAHLRIDVPQLMLTAGIDGGLKTLFEIMTEPGDLVGVLSPTYAMYAVYSSLFQVRLGEVGYRADLSLDRAALDALLERRPAVLFLPNPNQPIESAFDAPELESLAVRCRDRNILLVVDEAYHGFGCPTAIPLIAAHENVVVVRTFSKAFGLPSIRLGCLIAGVDNMAVLAKTRFAHESNALSNAVAEYLLDRYHIVEEYNRSVLDGREFVRGELTARKLATHGRRGNFLLIDFGSPERAAAVVLRLREQLVYVKGPWSAPWNRYITITVGPTEHMRRFIGALDAALKG